MMVDVVYKLPMTSKYLYNIYARKEIPWLKNRTTRDHM